MGDGDGGDLRRTGADLRSGRRVEPDAARAVGRESGVEIDRTLDAAETDDLVDPTERWVCERLVPALRATPDEVGNSLAALEGRYVPAGPSGAPTRGAAHVLPTGRNFYSVDPKALPSPLSWQVGQALAAALVLGWAMAGKTP